MLVGVVLVSIPLGEICKSAEFWLWAFDFNSDFNLRLQSSIFWMVWYSWNEMVCLIMGAWILVCSYHIKNE